LPYSFIYLYLIINYLLIPYLADLPYKWVFGLNFGGWLPCAGLKEET